jgi:SHS2 domain-containing protein
VTETRKRWDAERRAAAYTELEHPSDLFLEIYGRDLPELFENALFAFYDQVAHIAGFEARRELTLSVREPGLDEALRALLSEALYRFDTEGFVAVGGEVIVEGPEAGPPGAMPGDWRLLARLWGDNADRERHELLHEIKAATYHRLGVTAVDGGWKATVLFDV